MKAGAIQAAETAGSRSSIRTLEKVAEALALDERALGFKPDAGSDKKLGVRLRQLFQKQEVAGFDSSTVLQLAEAAWVMSREFELGKILGLQAPVHAPSRTHDLAIPLMRSGTPLPPKHERYLTSTSLSQFRACEVSYKTNLASLWFN
jgi:hypothetical protein